jgi:hypothetical protein
MSAQTPPKEFICPLTKELIVDPVVSRYGDNFERKAILTWLEEGNEFCPVTGNPLRPSCLVSDKALEWKIRSWLHQHGQEAPEHEDDDFLLRGVAGTVAIAPKKYICPLTKQLMKDPMMCCYGENYEREAILKHIDEHSDTCPMTGKPLCPHNLAPNAALKHEIHEWREHNGDHGEDLPALNVEDICAPHVDHVLKNAYVGTRGDTAVEEMRAQHCEKLRKEGIVEASQEDESLKDPFCATLILDEDRDTPQSLGHVF